MKRAFCAFLLSFSMLVWAAPQGQPAEYDINVHVSASRMVLEGNSTLHYQYLNVIIDGKKYELHSIGAKRGTADAWRLQGKIGDRRPWKRGLRLVAGI
jgi:hypothetical protein